MPSDRANDEKGEDEEYPELEAYDEEEDEGTEDAIMMDLLVLNRG